MKVNGYLSVCVCVHVHMYASEANIIIDTCDCHTTDIIVIYVHTY